jgi:DNA gyrase subunit A
VSEQSPLAKDIVNVSVEEEMKRSYLDYAMSVIVSRALPDVRDGLKPVHRRILHSMNESGFDYNKPYRKSARVTGDVMAKYHPHGNAAIYDAMVRMAQDFSLRLPLIDGQGNFGSMDGDPPAAERYTEARLDKAARPLLDDIDKDTVDFRPNYDESEQEPVVLPAKYPNLLVNGAGGIAVGMATNIPPHNLGELIDACCAMIDNPDLTVEELLTYVHGPDFPTGGIILGRSGILSAFNTGRGSVVMRGRTHFEEIRKDRQAIIITEVPFQVNKARMIERMAECVKNKIIEGISDLRDESDREGVRVVIEIKRDAVPDVVLNQLYRHTPLQTSFGVNMLALDRGQPKMMGILEILRLFIQFREEVIVRRVKFELGKAQRRAHVLIGLAVAVANLDEMIRLIKEAPDPQTAREEMLARNWPAGSVAPLIELVNEPGQKVQQGGYYRLSEVQARAILDLRLHRLTGLERDKIAKELEEIVEQIKEYLSILASREKVYAIMRQEFLEAKENFATPRRTTIEESEHAIDLEDLIQQEDMVVTVSQNGYIKRVPLATYRAQKRGGKGRSGMGTRDEDVVADIFVANTHTPILFFSNRGIAYLLKVYRLPLGSPQSLGKAMVNILPLEQGETISTVLALTGSEAEWQNKNIIFATSSGTVRRNNLEDFLNVRANGKIAMKLEEGEKLVAVKICAPEQDVLLTTRKGKCIRFTVDSLRVFASRASMGVRGIKLAKGDEVISLSILEHVDFTIEERDAYLRMSRQLRGNEEADFEAESTTIVTLSPERFNELTTQEQFVTTVTSKGLGKRTSAYEYRVSNRGGLGISNINLTSKNGEVVGSFITEDADELVLVTDGGKLIRFAIKDVRIAGRSTQGVTLFRLGKDEKVVSVARIAADELQEEELGTQDTEEALGAASAEGTLGTEERSAKDSNDQAAPLEDDTF